MAFQLLGSRDPSRPPLTIHHIQSLENWLKRPSSSFSFYGKHYKECVLPNVDIGLQSRGFRATSTASFRERLNLLDFRSCWIVFIHVVWGRPDGLLQFSKGEAVKILVSVSSGWSEHGETLCLDNSRKVWLPRFCCLTSSFGTGSRKTGAPASRKNRMLVKGHSRWR